VHGRGRLLRWVFWLIYLFWPINHLLPTTRWAVRSSRCARGVIFVYPTPGHIFLSRRTPSLNSAQGAYVPRVVGALLGMY
jgi:hypothetical protein